MFEIRPILSALLRHKSSTLLIVMQIAITFAVLVNSVSIIKQRIEMQQRESGLAEEQLITLNINAFGKDYDIEQNIRADIELLRNTPGVMDAVALNQIPMSNSGDSGMVASSQENFDQFKTFGTGFFHSDSHVVNTLGVKLIAGRNFYPSEEMYTSGIPDIHSVLVTQSLANKLYPKGDALGKQMHMGGGIEVTIIGIIEQMAGSWVHNPIFEDNVITPYMPLTMFKRILIRAENQVAVDELLGEVESLLINRNADRVIYRVNTVKELKRRSYSGDTAMTLILWIVIGLLVMVTALGIVGIASFNVSQRNKQIGTRRALGARKVDILRYFLTENILITSLGLIIGSVTAVAINMYLVEHFDMSPINWYLIPMGLVLMFSLGIIAVWLPASKAANISPAIATQSV